MKTKNCIFDIVYPEGCDKNNKPILKKVDEIEVDTVEEATEYVKHYNETHPGRTYYFHDNHSMRNCGVVYPNKVVLYGNDWTNMFFYGKIANFHRKYKKTQDRKYLKKIARTRRMWGSKFIRGLVKVCINGWDNLTWWMWGKWVNKWNDAKHERNRIKYFKKHHHDIQEPWSLDIHMLRDLRWNLKRLIEESQGIPNNFMKDAWFELNPNGTEEEWHKVCSFSPELDELSIKKRNECYLNLIHLIELYGFYAMTDVCEDGEEIDDKDFELIKVEGSWDRPEYKGMHERATQVWNQIWDEVKKYGQGMWD